MNVQPGTRININNGALKIYKKKKVYRAFSPNDVAIHPKTGGFMYLNIRNQSLLY